MVGVGHHPHLLRRELLGEIQGLPKRGDHSARLHRAASRGEPSVGSRPVRILLETHDSHRTAAAAARVLDRVAQPGAGALWDVLHTCLGGESPAASRRALAAHLGYVQVKDVRSAQELTPVGLGAGALPLAEAVAAVPPDGWLCWEYQKRWYPAAAELPGQLARGRQYLAGLVARQPLGGQADDGVSGRSRSEPDGERCRRGGGEAARRNETGMPR